MKRSITSILLNLLTALVAVQLATAASKPNIIWIFSDDHTNQAIGAWFDTVDEAYAELQRFLEILELIVSPDKVEDKSYIESQILQLSAYPEKRIFDKTLLRKS